MNTNPYAATGKTHTNKQSLSKERPVCQRHYKNQKGEANRDPAEGVELQVERCTRASIVSERCNWHNPKTRQSNQLMFLQSHLFRKKQGSQYCLARQAALRRSVETGRRCRICWAIDAGNPLWQAPACYKWVDAPRDMQRLKISPSHLMLAERTGKCVCRPLVLFLYLPVTHTAAAQAEPARHTVWLWQELRMNVKCGGSSQKLFNASKTQTYLCTDTSVSAH